MSSVTDQLTDLFRQTGKAHHAAFAATDGADDEWPLWYADYLTDKLPALVGKTLTKSELVYRLVDLSKRQSKEAPGVEWAAFYAQEFAKT
ncbi:MAG: hypothetical protein R3E39_17925 [Anaerolineae bacterium]